MSKPESVESVKCHTENEHESTFRDIRHMIRRPNESSKRVLNVALATHKAMGLHRKSDEKMKGNNKLLITEATFGFY